MKKYIIYLLLMMFSSMGAQAQKSYFKEALEKLVSNKAFTMNQSGAKYLKDYTIYITLEPCVMCAGALNWSQISRVVYAAEDIKRGYSLVGNLLHPTTIVTKGILKEESEKLLKDFFVNLRKNKY